MSNSINPQNAIYAILADSVYWDVREENNQGTPQSPDRTNSNWTPIPSDWRVIDERSGSGENRDKNPDLLGFTARAFQKGNEIVIAFAK